VPIVAVERRSGKWEKTKRRWCDQDESGGGGGTRRTKAAWAGDLRLEVDGKEEKSEDKERSR